MPHGEPNKRVEAIIPAASYRDVWRKNAVQQYLADHLRASVPLCFIRFAPVRFHDGACPEHMGKWLEPHLHLVAEAVTEGLETVELVV